jgi:hypothetical protein
MSHFNVWIVWVLRELAEEGLSIHSTEEEIRRREDQPG